MHKCLPFMYIHVVDVFFRLFYIVMSQIFANIFDRFVLYNSYRYIWNGSGICYKHIRRVHNMVRRASFVECMLATYISAHYAYIHLNRFPINLLLLPSDLPVFFPLMNKISSIRYSIWFIEHLFVNAAKLHK